MTKFMTLLAACVLGACASAPVPASACDPGDPVLADAAFVIATTPTAGTKVKTGFKVSGCSRTFESTVTWKLIGRNGSVLADGFTMGGGVDGPARFSFNVAFSVAAPEVGHLEVIAPDPSDGEGFPPGRTVLPLILMP